MTTFLFIGLLGILIISCAFFIWKRNHSIQIKDSTPREYFNPTKFFFGTVDNVKTDNVKTGGVLTLTTFNPSTSISGLVDENVFIKVVYDKPSGTSTTTIKFYGTRRYDDPWAELMEGTLVYEPLSKLEDEYEYTGLLLREFRLTEVYDNSVEYSQRIDSRNLINIQLHPKTIKEYQEDILIHRMEILSNMTEGLTTEQIKKALNLN